MTQFDPRLPIWTIATTRHVTVLVPVDEKRPVGLEAAYTRLREWARSNRSGARPVVVARVPSTARVRLWHPNSTVVTQASEFKRFHVRLRRLIRDANAQRIILGAETYRSEERLPPTVTIARGTFAEMKRELARRIVGEQGSVAAAARVLGVPRQTLQYWL